MRSFPLSKAAVEAAARELAPMIGASYGELHEHGEHDQGKIRQWAADILRAALAAWEPSEAQIEAGQEEIWKVGEQIPAGVPEAILAAVRTEAE